MKRFTLVGLTFALALGALGLAGRQAANAAVATSTFMVTATVVPSCTISTVGIAFGNYDPVVANRVTSLDANGSVTVGCTMGTTATIGMNEGSNQAAASTAAAPLRQMGTGINRVRYDLYQDVPHVVVWGDVGTPAVMTYTSIGMATQTFPIFGSMPPAQDVATGSYTDTVTATIQF